MAICYYYFICLNWVPRCTVPTTWQSDYMRTQPQDGWTLRRDWISSYHWWPVTWKHVVKHSCGSYTANLARFGPIYSIEVTGDFWPDVNSTKVALKPPWGGDGCIHQIWSQSDHRRAKDESGTHTHIPQINITDQNKVLDLLGQRLEPS